MNKNYWHQITEIRYITCNQKTIIAYIKDKRKTRKFKFRTIPYKYEIKNVSNPNHLEKLVFNSNRKIIASFNEGDYLKEFIQLTRNEYIFHKNNFPKQLSLF